MYHGTTIVHEKRYTDLYKPGLGTYSVCLGTVPVEHHVYVCDHCHHRYSFEGQAVEPFYCHSTACEAVKLVSITPAA